MKKHLLAIICLTFVLAFSCSNAHTRKLNLDFEQMESKTKNLVDWSFQKDEYLSIKPDDKTVHHGKYSLKIENQSKFPSASQHFGGVFRVENIVAQKSIKLAGVVKNENTHTDSCGFFILHEGDATQVKYVHSKNFQGSHDWQEYSVEVNFLRETENFYIGVCLIGGGKIWVDNLKLFIDGKQVTSIQTLDYVADNKEMKWLKNNVTSLKTVDAGNGFDDLQDLKKAIGDARIVALGECTHGSSEIFKMKHRLVEFLATEMGFTIFSIEANMPEAYKLNDYVLYGKGNPRELLKGMYFWTWNAQEVLDMIEWMKNFNAIGKGKIQFTGFDMQSIPVALKNIEEFAEKNDRHLKVKIDSLIQLVNQFRNGSSQLTEEDAHSIHQKCLFIQSALINHPNAKVLEKREYDWLLQNAQVSVDGSDYRLMTDYTFRDKCMAQNVKWIADQNPEAKIILWAHNGHIHKYPGSMGKNLDTMFGNQYFNLGFLSNSGTYTACLPKGGLSDKNKLDPGEPGSFEYSFHKAGIPVFFFDFNRVKDPQSQWLKRNMNYRGIGAMAMEKQFYAQKISKLYNSIIFIDLTHSSKCFNL